MTADRTPVGVLFAGEAPSEGPTADDLGSVDRFEVARSRDFVHARERVETSAVDCVVATHHQDGFDGVALLETLRQERAEFPVVLVPEAIDAEVARRAVEADATALVPASSPDAVDAVVDAVEANVPAREEGGARMPITDLTPEAERRLKERALDEAPIGITISDATQPDDPIIYMNDSFAEITGYPHEEVVGANHRFLQGPETDPDRVAELGEAVAEKRDARVVLQNYTREGAMFWNQVDISPIRDEDGEVPYYVGFQMDVTERRRAQEQLQAERQSLDRLLDRVKGLADDVTAALVRADDREEIERSVAERIGGGDEYAAAWVGRYDEAADRIRLVQQAGDWSAALDSVDLDAGAAGTGPLEEVIERQEALTVEDGDAFYEVEDDETYALVPLTYRSTTYGVLGVLDAEGRLGDRERVLLGSLGRSIGASINDLMTKRMITTDTAVTVGVELSDDDVFLVELADEVGARFTHEATIANDRDPGVLTLVSTDHDDVASIVETAGAREDVLDAETVADTDDGSVVQFRLVDSPLVDVLSEFGSRVTSMDADGSALDLEFRVGTERAARRVLGELRETYDHVELVAYHEDESRGTPQGFREELRNRLTERQLTALKKAHAGGYFEWPRRAEGEQLAESMGIVPSTYHQHLQAAKRKLVEAFFEE
ncbi:MAG: bacterio-opsin activator domain-containing protein [Haloferacaceae archaeon]